MRPEFVEPLEEKIKCKAEYKCKNKEMIQKMLDSGDYYVEEVSYKIYKNNGLIAVQDTYNNDTKTIQVIVRKE